LAAKRLMGAEENAEKTVEVLRRLFSTSDRPVSGLSYFRQADRDRIVGTAVTSAE
jgi:hypothetical protein